MEGVQFFVNFHGKSLQLYYKSAFCQVFFKDFVKIILFQRIWETHPIAATEYDFSKKKQRYLKLNRKLKTRNTDNELSYCK